jgi:hypothetical chaperone protein
MRQGSCGLDFGTSNSTLGVMKDGKPALVALEDGQPTLPSAIFYNYEDEKTYFGREALQEYIGGAEGRLMRSLKSVLGTSLINETTQLKKRRIAFPDIIAEFVSHLKRIAEARIGTALTHVIVGRPAHFVDDDPIADAQAQEQLEAIIRSTGFREIEFQYEPIAAAFEYEMTAGPSNELALIVDIGGGTADFSIIRTGGYRANDKDRSQDILATYGVHVGGTDIDRILAVEKIMPLLGYRTRLKGQGLPAPSWIYNDLATWHRINMLYTHTLRTQVKQMILEAEKPELLKRLLNVLEHKKGHYLLGCAEAMKVALTDRTEARMPLDIGAEIFSLDLEQTQFAEMLAGWLDAISAAIAKTLDLAAVPVTGVSAVFLTGGTTLSPAVRERVKAMFGNARLVVGDSLGSVGLGLTLAAARRFQ